MRLYKYLGKNLDGKVVKGHFATNNVYELVKHVKEKGYYLLSFKYQEDSKRLSWNRRKISCDTISIFCSQFKITLQAGLTILETLHILYFQCSSKLLKENLNFISEEIRKGENLHTSLERCPFSFPSFLCDMIRVGEESGKLEEAFEELANYYHKENKLKKKILSAMSYPAIVFSLTIISILILLTTVIPSLASVLISLDAQLPFITRATISLSSLVSNNLILVIFVIVLVSGLIALLLKCSKRSLHNNKIILKIPMVGKVYKNTIEMKLSRVLSMLLSTGTNVVRALEISMEIAKNQYLRAKLKEVIYHIRNGYSFSEAMINTSFFSPFLLSLVKVGEETGNLEIMLQKAVMIFEENVDNDLNKLIELIQPVMLLFVSAIVGIVISSVIIPIFDIASSI